jgi:hypothetical protein
MTTRPDEDRMTGIRTLLAATEGDDAEYETSAGETAPAPHKAASDYSFEHLQVPQGMEFDAKGFGTAGEWCLKAGLNQGELNGVLASYSRALTDPGWNSEEMNAERQRTTLNFLRERWGDDVMARLVAIRRHIEATGGDDLVDFLDETGLGNDPFLILALDRAVAGRRY